MPLSGIIGATAAMFAKAAPPPPASGPAVPYPPGALASSAMPKGGPILREALIIEKHLESWLESLYVASERKKFLFKPSISIKVHARDDLTQNAFHYEVTMRVVLVCHDGQNLPVSENWSVSHLIERGEAYPLDEAIMGFKAAIIRKMPDWRELYLARHEPDKDNISWPPSMLTLPGAGPVRPSLMPPPMPGSISHGASAYAKAYTDKLAEMARMRSETERMKIDTALLYGHSPYRAEILVKGEKT